MSLVRLLHSIQHLPRSSLSSLHGLLIGRERSLEEVEVVRHRLLRQLLKCYLLLLSFLSQFLHQRTSALCLILERLHSFSEEALEKLHVALLGSYDTLRDVLMGLQYLHSLRKEALGKLGGTLLSGHEMFCHGLVGLEDLHSLRK